MEETAKEQPPVAVPGKSKLRCPLRSAAKVKPETPPVADLSNPSTSRRGKSGSSVSKSVGVLDFSSKEKSAKLPKRLSIPNKSVANVGPKSAGIVMSMSEARTKRSIGQSKSHKKFNMLASPSYWLSQIKLSESVSNHSISIGFFKLALEAGCEPIQRMRDELKLYVHRHEIRESVNVKELLESYNITENQQQFQVLETLSQVSEQGTRSSDDDEVQSSSTTGTRNLRPKSLNAVNAQISTVRESAKKTILQKNTASSRSVPDKKKPERPSKQVGKEKGKMKKQGKKSTTSSEEGEVSPTLNAVVAPEENKENVGKEGPVEEARVTEVC